MISINLSYRNGVRLFKIEHVDYRAHACFLLIRISLLRKQMLITKLRPHHLVKNVFNFQGANDL